MEKLYKQILSVLGMALVKLVLINIKDFSRDPKGGRDTFECAGKIITVAHSNRGTLYYTGRIFEGIANVNGNKVLFTKRPKYPTVWIPANDEELKQRVTGVFNMLIKSMSKEEKDKVNHINLLVRNCVPIAKKLVADGVIKPQDFKHQCFKETVCGDSSAPAKIIKKPIYNTLAFKSVMELAHHIRRSEKLEGHYHAQMKMALEKAHAIWNSDDIKICCKPGAVVVQINGRQEEKKTPTTTLEETEVFISSVMKTFMRGRKFKFYYRTKAFKEIQRKGVEYINSIPRETKEEFATPC